MGREVDQPLADDVSDAFRAGQVAHRPGDGYLVFGQFNGTSLDERPPELADQEGVAGGESVHRVGAVPDGAGEVGVRRALNELRHLLGRESAEVQAHDVVSPSEIGEGVDEWFGKVGAGIAEGGNEEQAGLVGGANEMA